MRAGVMLAAAVFVSVSANGCGSDTTERPRVEGGDASRGSQLILAYGCDACHEIPGIEGAGGLAGAPLNRWSERSYIAGSLPNTPDHLVTWIVDPQAVEPGTAMPTLGLSEEDARDVAAYLFSLGSPPVEFRSTTPRELLRWFGLRPGSGEDG